VLSTALIREHLQDFSDMAAVELAFIDESTTTARLSQELRWNSAYYRLAQGL
jgi:L-arabinose isomerase